MINKYASATMAVALSFSVLAASIQPAEAGRGRGLAAGIIAGAVGLAILGAASRSHGHGYYGEYCYRGPRRCGWRGRRCFENRWGEYVCRGGRYKCHRPLICE